MGATDRAETRARLHSTGAFGEWGSALEHQRYVQEIPRRPGGQYRCHCGCKGRTTHAGMANGLCLTSGCELYVRRWVRDPHA